VSLSLSNSKYTMALEDSMWAALSPLQPVFPHLRPRPSRAEYQGNPVRALSVPLDSFCLEAQTLVDHLQLPHVAKVYAYEPFEHSDRKYYAVLQEGHVKTLHEDVRCRLERNVPFDPKELDLLLITLLETLKTLFKQGLCYFMDVNKVLCFPVSLSPDTLSVKIADIWTSFRPNSSDLPCCTLQSLECLLTLSSFLISCFPTASCPTFDNSLSEFISELQCSPNISPPNEEEKLKETETIGSNANAKTLAETNSIGLSQAVPFRKEGYNGAISERDEKESQDAVTSCRCSLL